MERLARCTSIDGIAKVYVDGLEQASSNFQEWLQVTAKHSSSLLLETMKAVQSVSDEASGVAVLKIAEREKLEDCARRYDDAVAFGYLAGKWVPAA